MRYEVTMESKNGSTSVYEVEATTELEAIGGGARALLKDKDMDAVLNIDRIIPVVIDEEHETMIVELAEAYNDLCKNHGVDFMDVLKLAIDGEQLSDKDLGILVGVMAGNSIESYRA